MGGASPMCEDPSVATLFRVESIVSDDSIRRLFSAIDEAAGQRWVASASAPLWGALPERVILDWDATVQTKYGHQEGAARGYNPQKPGRKSFHPLIAVGAGTRLCAAYRFRSGDTVTATQWAIGRQFVLRLGPEGALRGGRSLTLQLAREDDPPLARPRRQLHAGLRDLPDPALCRPLQSASRTMASARRTLAVSFSLNR